MGGNQVLFQGSDRPYPWCQGHGSAVGMPVELTRNSWKKRNTSPMTQLSEKLPSVGDVVCHCSRHKQGSGCMSKHLIESARIKVSLILSKSQSAKEFATKMRALARHARDEREWAGGRCDLHLPWVCSCNVCDDEENLRCERKNYHTRCLLYCPFHCLAYKIDS